MTVYASWLREDDDGKSVDLSRLPELIDREARPDVPKCAVGVKIFTRQCGHRQAVPVRCGKPTCPECERVRSVEAVFRWQPVIDAMVHPKMTVLAVKSDPVLEVAGRRLAECYARFLDLRIGGRKRGYFKAKTAEFIAAHAEEFDRHHAEDVHRKDTAGWLESCGKFWDRDLDCVWGRKQGKAAQHLEALEVEVRSYAGVDGTLKTYVRLQKRCETARRHVEALADGMKVRDLFTGVRSLDITWNAFTGWHPHFHLAHDSIFIPFPALLALWMEACTVDGKSVAAFVDPDEELKPGECIGRTAHISALRKPQEVLKYVTKHVDGGPHALPDEKKGELEAYLHGKKRIWPLGNARPRELEKAPCPSCKHSDCKCDHGEVLGRHLGDGIWSSCEGRYARVYRLRGLGLTWDEVTPNLDGHWVTTFIQHSGDCLTDGERVLALLAAAGPPGAQNGALVG